MAEKKSVYYATGKRKTSKARVFLTPGTGKVTVNKRKLEDYFKVPSNYVATLQALETVNLKSKYDADIKVKGGGTTGQAEAIRHGLARALLLTDEKLRAPLKASRFLTRDSRKVERKKYGRHKSRRSTQYSKR